jgi:lon-related putative ATP-dependent protease
MSTKLFVDALYRVCDPGLFNFETTDDIKAQEDLIGQERALKAIDFGLSLENKGFNIFALGEPGTGKSRAIRNILTERAAGMNAPSDWCYVYNFKDPDMPLAISMDPGQAVLFQKDMGDLVKNLMIEIPKTFESKEAEQQRNVIMEEFNRQQRTLITAVEDEAASRGFALKRSAQGYYIVPVSKKTNEPLTEEEFAALDDETKASSEEIGRMLTEKLNESGRIVRKSEKQMKEELAKLERHIALGSVGHFIDEIRDKHSDHPRIPEYLEAVQEDILSHLDDFRGVEEPAPSPIPFIKMPKQEISFARYMVNVIVNNGETKGAPVVFESNPTYFNLFGKLEYKVQYGMATTDFTMIRAGALHRANGGFIVINALDLLKNMISYDSLKRSIRNREIKIDDIWEQYRMVSTTALKPEAIPLNVKVILSGVPYLYYLLYNQDEEYRELFKVKADFNSKMERTVEGVIKYAVFVSSCCKDEKLRPLDKEGVARIVEYGSRLANHQFKLSTRFNDIADLLREADYWAGKDGSKVISGAHVLRAQEEKIYRSGKIDEQMQEMMIEDSIIVNTSGEKVGQVNGLAVLNMGDYMFGKPSRISARSYVGRAGVVNIERETKMSGKIHEKAIMIITHYLGSKYAKQKPISLSASITFEQLYDMVEGDSATCAEMYALLSSISGVPLKQCMAVTGSMDQNGEVQPIGGANEKIEGFYQLCKIRGLDGSHGVIIPRRNIKNLMLKKEVTDSVSEGKFNIYAIDRVEEGFELLTGMSAGEAAEDGKYPEGTLNYLVMKRLEEISTALEKKKDRDRDDEEKPQKREDDNGCDKCEK